MDAGCLSVWRMDSISWRKTLVIWHTSKQWLVVNTPFREVKSHHNRKDGSKGSAKLARIGSCNLSFAWYIWSWDQNLVFEQRQFSLLGQNFSWIKLVCDEFKQHWTAKFQKFSSENMRQNWMHKILHVYRRQKQNHKEENLSILHQRIVPIGKKNWIQIEQGEYSFSDDEVCRR